MLSSPEGQGLFLFDLCHRNGPIAVSGLAVSRHFQRWKICQSIRRIRRLLTISRLTRLNGRDNLAAHFPDDAGLPPDLGNGRATCSYLMAEYGDGGLGPKVYFALAAKQDDGYHGSTRLLHSDLTDAVNICVFAARQSDRSQGVPDGTSFRPRIQRGSEKYSPCIPSLRILSSLKTRILPLPDCVN